MRGFIIIGAPGAGKTAIIRQLELDGFSVVNRRPLTSSLLRMRKEALNSGDIPRSLMQSLICKGTVRFEHLINRTRFSFTTVCVVCTAALAVYLRHAYTTFFSVSWTASKRKGSNKNRVFFIRHLGYHHAVRFEKIHEGTYRDFGFELVPVERGSLMERVGVIKAAISLSESEFPT